MSLQSVDNIKHPMKKTGKAHDQQSEAPETPEAASPAAETKALQEEVERLTTQRLQMLAEIDNTKKRLQREKEEFARYAGEALVRKLLPILDSLDQGIASAASPPDLESVRHGVRLIAEQLRGLMEREGVERIPTVGERFDPYRHEAVAQVAARDGQADDTIVEEIQVGYAMHGKVIRPAMVKVAKSDGEGRQVD